jgi:hypothetical protein
LKRITKIEIENFRAFFGSYKLDLPRGESLLLYGENGSGKSSFYKALYYFFNTAIWNDHSFEVNNYVADATPQGKIDLTFADVVLATGLPDAATARLFSFGNVASTHKTEPFIQNAARIKGFLEYKHLLQVYLNQGPNPNLFVLIVEELLRDHIPPGGTKGIGEEWLETENLLHGLDRRYNDHKRAYANLVPFHSKLDTFLRRLFFRVNLLLLKYFKMNLRVAYALPVITFDYRHWIWDSNKELKLQLKVNGVLLSDHTEYLNEARLSALAICIYLASLLENPTAFDYKVLFLDDVFIGLDSGNRIPIARILKEEFKDYQIFITTYDRNWFELAQRFFKTHAPEKWTWAELYSAKHKVGSLTFEVPVLIPYEENYDRAVFYLHHKTKPDYPAAANFFRKSAEEILKSNLPEHEIRDDNYALIETYKLGALVNSGLHFLSKIGVAKSLLLELQNALPSLLHPLSHYELSAQVYKVELEEIQRLLPKLDKQLKDLKATYRVFIPQGRMLKLNFTISATQTGHYEIYSKETIYALRNAGGIVTLSAGGCHCKTCYTMNGTTKVPGRDFGNNEAIAQYTSVQDGYDKIYNDIHARPTYSHIARAANCLTEFSYHNENGNHSLENHKGHVVW